MSFRCTEPLLVDDYTTNRTTGSFIIIDPTTNATVGAGVIRVIATTHASPNVVRHGGRLSRADRFAALGTAGATLLFTGLSGPASRRWPPAWRRPSCAAADPPSCSTGTTCATG